MLSMTMMKFFTLLRPAGLRPAGSMLVRGIALGAILAVPAAGIASAQMVQRIAAVVNDSVISAYDLEQRLGLVVATAGVPPTPENLERIRPQILRALVDERLQLQEAGENNIDIKEDQVNKAIERLGQRNGMSLPQIETFLKSVNVNIETLRSQVLAELAWNELVQNRFGARVSVTDTEVDTVLERIINQSEQASYLVSEVLVPVETPEDETRARNSAAQLVSQLRQGGDIRAIAGQFSQAPTAANGGDAGWIIDGQLSNALNSALRGMNIGDTSDPIRTTAGYHILQLRDRRLSGDQQDPMDAAITIEAVNIPYQPDMPRAQLERVSKAVRDAVASDMACGEVESWAKSIDPASRFNRLQDRPMRSFPAPARPALLELNPGQWGPPQRTPEGLELVLMCDRKTVERQLPDRDDIENQLFNQELAMMSRRYLRDLRRSAVVEMR
jgi:peptidyl-prolyl cis-trans isomerase SurA